MRTRRRSTLKVRICDLCVKHKLREVGEGMSIGPHSNSAPRVSRLVRRITVAEWRHAHRT